MLLKKGVSRSSGLRNRLKTRAGMLLLTRKVVQVLALLGFVILFIASRRGGWAANLVNIPLRLDPLVILANLLASRVFLAGSALALLIVALTLIVGRAWCGWLCPLGTVLDWFNPKSSRKKSTTPPESWRSVKYYLLLVILIAAIFGNLTLLLLDPLTIFFRTLTVSIWPAVDQAFTVIESALYRAPGLGGFISTIDTWLRPVLLPTTPTYYRDTLLYATVFIGVILLNLAAPRFWCRYLCPLGGFLGILSKVALVRRQVGEECKGCVLCTKTCPTGTIDPDKNFASDPGECTVCLDCLEGCPRGATTFKANPALSEWNHYDPSRRQALAAFGTTIAALALLRSDAHARREHDYLLQPPGGRENDILSKCIRCGECMRACPTSALQPAISEAGLGGLWTPVLIPRLGYCDYSCNACGQVCPVQAIPPLSLDEKRKQVLGKAYIDQNRCIAWSDHRDCIVCEEMCPLPEKAILLQETQITSPESETIAIKLPYVLRERCIGCGICEYKCPVNGQAAIRVYIPESEAIF